MPYTLGSLSQYEEIFSDALGPLQFFLIKEAQKPLYILNLVILMYDGILHLPVELPRTQLLPKCQHTD